MGKWMFVCLRKLSGDVGVLICLWACTKVRVLMELVGYTECLRRVFIFFWRAEGFSGGVDVLGCTECLNGGVDGLKGKLEVSLTMIVLWKELYV